MGCLGFAGGERAWKLEPVVTVYDCENARVDVFLREYDVNGCVLEPERPSLEPERPSVAQRGSTADFNQCGFKVTKCSQANGSFGVVFRLYDSKSADANMVCEPRDIESLGVPVCFAWCPSCV